MDLIKEIQKSPLYTLHSHTQFCDGRATIEEFGKSASEAGFSVYAFTPHSPVPIESSCNMAMTDVDAYKAEVKRVQKLYPEVKFLTGMEIDYLGPQWGPAISYFRNMELDFSIGSVHFIPSQKGELVDIDGHFDDFKVKMAEDFDNDIRYVVETYFRQSIEMVKAGGFEIMGHFDKIKHNAGLFHPGLEEEEWYKRCVDSLIETIIDSGVIVEINTKAWTQHKQLFPAQRHWRRLIDAGVEIVVNSDAHYTDKINASRMEVLKALEYVRNSNK